VCRLRSSVSLKGKVIPMIAIRTVLTYGGYARAQDSLGDSIDLARHNDCTNRSDLFPEPHRYGVKATVLSILSQGTPRVIEDRNITDYLVSVLVEVKCDHPNHELCHENIQRWIASANARATTKRI
jgi:hypothetical protein